MRRVLRICKKLCVMGIKLLCYLFKSSPKKIDGDLVVLGTGPSLKKDIHKVIEHRSEYSVMVVNSFCVDPMFEVIKPEYCVLADPAYFYWDSSKGATNAGEADAETFAVNFKNKVTWDITLIMPKYASKCSLVEYLKDAKNIHFDFMSYDNTRPLFVNKYKAFNKNVSAPLVQNVLVFCLYYGIYYRFDNIYLFGSDHNWFLDLSVGDDNIVYINENHFYEKEHHKVHQMIESDGTPVNIGYVFGCYERAFNAYYVVKDYADYNKVKVYNEASVSYIDAFDRKSGKFNEQNKENDKTCTSQDKIQEEAGISQDL